MSDIKISVIVPVYNVERYIKQCVDSIINQTYRNLEIILVDDGSPDNSGKICDEYSFSDDRIRVIHKENGGHVSARKAGVGIATGDYITFVDSDDWIDTEAYAHAAEVIRSHGVDVFIFGLKRVSSVSTNYEHENLKEGLYNKNSLYEEICKIDKQDLFYTKIITTVCWNKVIKADLIKSNINNVDNTIKIGEDAALIYPVLLDAESYYITHNAYYNYRMNNESVMHKFAPDRYLSVEKVIRTVYSSVKKHGYDSDSVIMHQLGLYTFDLMLITDTCKFINTIRDIFPNVKDNDRILFYGKGVFAQNLKYLAEKDKSHSIVGFIDSVTIDKLDEYDYDIIIIAVTISSFVEEILKTLRTYGVDENKIICLKNSDINSYEYLKRICEE
ncbi:MAG: glycosyltransferase family 2 protein [Oscillospiraceae bacterium]